MGNAGRVLCAWISLAAFAFVPAPAAQPTADAPTDQDIPSSGGDAPWQLFDAMALATVDRDAAAATQIKARLVLEHPESLYARYVVTTFAQPQEYRKLLQDQLKERQKELANGFAEAFSRAAQLGSTWFGPSFMSDDAFALQWALAGYETNDYRVEFRCREKLNQSKKEAIREIAEIAFDRSLSAVQKVSRLHAIEDPAVPLFKQYFACQLSGDERELPDMLRVEVETLLEARKFGDALPLVEKLTVVEETPQVLFWRAWCLAAGGRTADATAAIESLARATPDDPWTACAVEIGKSLDMLEVSMADTADLVLTAAERVRGNDTDGFEGTVTYRMKNGRTISVYVGVLFGGGHFEIVVHENGRIVLAYKAAQGQGRTYCDGDQTIQTFRQNATYPVVAGHLDAHGQTLKHNWNVNMSNAADAMSQTRERIKISASLLTREGLTQVLRGQLVGQGVVPAAVSRDAGGSRLTLLQPQARKPELKRYEIHFAPDATLTRVDLGQLTCENLRYGPRESFQLSPPPWPELPAMYRDEMDPAALFRMLGTAYSLLDPQPATVASVPSPEQH